MHHRSVCCFTASLVVKQAFVQILSPTWTSSDNFNVSAMSLLVYPFIYRRFHTGGTLAQTRNLFRNLPHSRRRNQGLNLGWWRYTAPLKDSAVVECSECVSHRLVSCRKLNAWVTTGESVYIGTAFELTVVETGWHNQRTDKGVQTLLSTFV